MSSAIRFSMDRSGAGDATCSAGEYRLPACYPSLTVFLLVAAGSLGARAQRRLCSQDKERVQRLSYGPAIDTIWTRCLSNSLKDMETPKVRIPSSPPLKVQKYWQAIVTVTLVLLHRLFCLRIRTAVVLPSSATCPVFAVRLQ